MRPGLSQCQELPTYEATPSDIATSSFPLHRLAAHRAGGVGVWWVPVGQPNRGKARVCSRMAVLGLSKRTEASEAGVRRDGREAKFLKLRRSSVGFFCDAWTEATASLGCVQPAVAVPTGPFLRLPAPNDAALGGLIAFRSVVVMLAAPTSACRPAVVGLIVQKVCACTKVWHAVVCVVAGRRCPRCPLWAALGLQSQPSSD